MFPQCVTSSEQGKSSSRIATFILWTGAFWDGISSIPDETVIAQWLGPHYLVCGNSEQYKKLDASCKQNATLEITEGRKKGYTTDGRGTAVAQWLRCCATNRKVAGSIPDGVIGIFH